MQEKSANSTFGGVAAIGNKSRIEAEEKKKKDAEEAIAKIEAAKFIASGAINIPGQPKFNMGVPLAPPVIPGLTPGTVPGALPVVPPNAVPGSFGVGTPTLQHAVPAHGAGLAPPGAMDISKTPGALPTGMDVEGAEYKAVMPTALPSDQHVAFPAGAAAAAGAGSKDSKESPLGAFGIAGSVVPGAMLMQQKIEVDLQTGRVIPPSNASAAQVEYKTQVSCYDELVILSGC